MAPGPLLPDKSLGALVMIEKLFKIAPSVPLNVKFHQF